MTTQRIEQLEELIAINKQLEKAHALLISVYTLCKDESTVEMINDYFEQGGRG